jgi:hypothetical protein
MATKASFTTDEWNQLRKAPMMAGLIVAAASPSGPIGLLQEMFAMGKLIAETKSQGGSNELVGALVADLATGEGREQARRTEIQGMSPDQARSHALEACRKAAALVQQKATPGEADGFKRWLVAISRRVAEAAKEGGFLGFGGSLVSEQEATALRDVASALGVAVDRQSGAQA